MPAADLRGLTRADVEILDKLGIRSATDLLLHLPSSWQDRTRITPIAQLQPGVESQVEGRVVHAFQPPGRRMFSVQLQDGTGRMEMLFFRYPYAQEQQRLKNARVRCFGKVRSGRGRSVCMIYPRYSVLSETEPSPSLAEHLTPLYPGSGGTRGQKRLEKMIASCLELARTPGALADPVSPLLPPDMPLMSLLEALQQLHQLPPDTPDQEQIGREARARLALDELIAGMLGHMQAGEKIRRLPAQPMRDGGERIRQLLDSLPFQLTAAQHRVRAEIAADMARNKPMLRLLQGDVGSGKTLVAVCAALQAIDTGWQAALMAPTEVLVEQHLFNLRTWFAPLGLDVAALTASTPPAESRAILDALKSGELAMVVGTHALFEERVHFAQLGLVIVDEQHRFGVHQRLRLVERGRSLIHPHQLTMTATPIPRTLQMIQYTEMDVSVLDEMPPGRRPVHTTRHLEKDRPRIIERIGQRCTEGHRVYWVCALIEESDNLEARAATRVAEELAAALPQVSVGLIHGRLKAADKSAALEDFKTGRTQLLVATTVIEVGLDVPEATLIVIENPERFGLAQLHQLRGRVGRAERQSHCVLLHGADLGETAERRLEILCQHHDGFRIAEQDLELRGPGELLGVRQAGEQDHRLFDHREHRALLAPARQIASQLARNPDDSTKRLQQRWLAQRLEYARV